MNLVGRSFARETFTQALSAEAFVRAMLDFERALANSERLSTLIATRDPNDPTIYRWDVRLQGGGETVFIDA